MAAHHRVKQNSLILSLAFVALAFLPAASWGQTDAEVDITTERLHFALGAVVNEVDREAQIVERLAEGADPLATVEAGNYTWEDHKDSFSYLIGLAEMAARQEEAGADYLPDDWRDRAWRYHFAMAAVVDAPDEAEYFLYRTIGMIPAPPDDGSISLVVEAARRNGVSLRYLEEEIDQDFADLTGSGSSDAQTEPGDRLSYWQRYERDAYGGDSGESDR